MPSESVTQLLDRAASGEDSPGLKADLRQIVRVQGGGNTVAVGDHSIALHGSHDIRIDNRVYHGAQAEAIRRALNGALDPIGPLHGLGGVLTTIGIVIGLIGMALFIYALIGTMAGAINVRRGPPAVLLIGFAIAFVGAAMGIVGKLVSGWQQPRR
jgi:hypothetical protein